MENIGDVLSSPALKKQKFKVIELKPQGNRGEELYILFLSSDVARVLLLLNQKVMWLLFLKMSLSCMY